MSVVRPISPVGLKAALERGGFRLIDEGEHNWVLAYGDDGEPVLIPKHGDAVSVPVMDNACHRARGTPAFREILERAANEPAAADPDDDDADNPKV